MLAELAAKARLLIAAERRNDIRPALAVDQNGPGLKCARQAVRAAHVAGPHGSGKAVNRVVTLQDPIFFALERNRRCHRAEYLFPGNSHAVVNVSEDGGLDEIALAMKRLTTGCQSGTFSLAQFDIVHHPVKLLSGYQRPHSGFCLEWISDGHTAAGFDEMIEEVIVNLALDKDPRAGGADL